MSHDIGEIWEELKELEKDYISLNKDFSAIAKYNKNYKKALTTIREIAKTSSAPHMGMIYHTASEALEQEYKSKQEPS